jgi:hypothetical protein
MQYQNAIYIPVRNAKEYVYSEESSARYSFIDSST